MRRPNTPETNARFGSRPPTVPCPLTPVLCVRLSDLCTAFGKDMMKLVEVRPLINDLLTEGRRSKTAKTKTLATWATKELRKLKSQAWCVAPPPTRSEPGRTASEAAAVLSFRSPPVGTT